MRSLHGRLAVTLLGLLAVLGASWIALSYLATERYAQEVRQVLHRDLAAHLLNEGLLLENGEVDPEGLEHVIHMLMVVNPSIEVYVLDADGAVRGYSAPPGSVERDSVSLGPVKRFLAGETRLPLLGDDPKDAHVRKVFSVAPIGDAANPRGYAYVVLGGALHDTIVGRLRRSAVLREAALVAVAALAATFFAGLLLFTMLTRRVRRLSGKVQAFEAGYLADADPRPAGGDTDAGDEIDRLEQSFERMRCRIGEQIHDLERVDRVRRELIANVSHDLRTPLASLQGYVETLLIKGRDLDARERERYLKIASRHCAQLARRINDLFELAKLDASAVRLERETVSIPELVHDVAQKFQLEAEQKGIQLRVAGERELPFIDADIRLVERVIENLLGNAVKHTPPGGQVELSTDFGPESIRVSVRDTGPGIAPDELPSIFDRFYRSRDRAEETAGAGLGLAIAKRIVELHGGAITVSSTVNAGALFTFDLPFRGRHEAQSSSRPES